MSAQTAAHTAGRFTMFSTPWCGYCHRLRGQLDRARIEYSVVDISHDRSAAELVEVYNGGNQTVPTLLFPDGSTLTNPSLRQVEARLADLDAAAAGLPAHH